MRLIKYLNNDNVIILFHGQASHYMLSSRNLVEQHHFLQEDEVTYFLLRHHLQHSPIQCQRHYERNSCLMFVLENKEGKIQETIKDWCSQIGKIPSRNHVSLSKANLRRKMGC